MNNSKKKHLNNKMSVVRFINEINRKLCFKRWMVDGMKWETDGILIDAKGFSTFNITYINH